MPVARFVAWMLLAGTMVLGASAASGQNYPDKPIRLVTAGAGGGVDFSARLIAQGVSASLGQQVIVDNRGGSPIIPAQTVAKAPPDGYTVLFYSNGMWLLPLIQRNVPYDPVRDFAPITMATSSPNILVVHPSLPSRSVKDLIAIAKARPGELNYGASPIGSTIHLAAELFNSKAGVKTVLVPYKGVADALSALIAGEVQLMFPAAGSAMPHLKSGRLRALAVTSKQPSALAPGLPTMEAAGLPGFDVWVAYAILAPAGTPATIVNRLNQAIVQALKPAETREKLLNAGLEVVGSSPEQLAAAMKTETVTLGKVIKDAGIRID
jgi:tripartite-type tricarboxylate transporter receptor subunit TctC